MTDPDHNLDGEPLMTAKQYAVALVARGAESTAEDDLNDNGDVTDADHEKAMDLAIDLAHAIHNHPDEFLAWAKPHLPERSRVILAEA